MCRFSKAISWTKINEKLCAVPAAARPLEVIDADGRCYAIATIVRLIQRENAP